MSDKLQIANYIPYYKVVLKHVHLIHLSVNAVSLFNMVNLNSGDIPRSKSKTKSLLLQVSNEFCESTSLHGYSYIANGNSVALKIFWSTIIVCLTGIGIKFLIVNTQDYMESRLVTGIDSSSAPLNVS